MERSLLLTWSFFTDNRELDLNSSKLPKSSRSAKKCFTFKSIIISCIFAWNAFLYIYDYYKFRPKVLYYKFEINSRIEYTVSKECPVCSSSHTRSNFGSCLSNPPNLSSRSSLEWTPIRTSYDGRQAPFFHN